MTEPSGIAVVVEPPVDIRPSSASPIADLTRRMVEGDEEAFQEFDQLYFARLYRRLLVLTRSREVEAREALQETFCRVVRYVRRFEDEEVFWCWLLALARSAVRDAGRKRQRYRRLLERYARRWLPVRLEPTEEDSSLWTDRLQSALVELSVADRSLIEAKYLSGTSVRDLAATTGLTERAVESRLRRLRRGLRARILEMLKGDDR